MEIIKKIHMKTILIWMIRAPLELIVNVILSIELNNIIVVDPHVRTVICHRIFIIVLYIILYYRMSKTQLHQ